MMEFVNAWTSDKNGLSKEDLEKFLLILAPFAPFMTEELWQRIEVSRESRVPRVSRADNSHGTRDTFDTRGTLSSIHSQPWPSYDKSLLEEEEVTIVIQVNGKVRSQIEVRSGMREARSEIEELAKKDERVLKYLEGKEIKKVIFVPGKLINFVI